MLKKGQKLYSILLNKCPRCHTGKFWPNDPYSNLFFNSGNLYEYCPHCGLKYYREIGFWYGAMYVSYGLSIGLFLFGWGLTTIVLPEDWSIWWQIGIICSSIILLMPLNYFLSRLIWINFFVAYEPGKIDSVEGAPKMSGST